MLGPLEASKPLNVGAGIPTLILMPEQHALLVTEPSCQPLEALLVITTAFAMQLCWGEQNRTVCGVSNISVNEVQVSVHCHLVGCRAYLKTLGLDG